jgi:protocatechuate 3,4-dioxygenase beta subunit
MNCSKSFLLLIYMLFSSSFSIAESEAFYFNNLNRCKITEEKSNDYEPEKFQPTNNLLRRPGQVALFCGEKILVHGKVLDDNCVPVSDAKVYVWQVDCGGRYPYQPLKDMIDEDLIDLNSDTTFTGNGVATTNNNGEFYFLTIYPSAAHSISPHINVRVEHRRLGELQTIVTLKNHKVQNPMSNPELAVLAAEASDASIYDFKIVMPGESIQDY